MLSIIIITGYDENLKDTIDSIKSQKIRNCEIIIVVDNPKTKLNIEHTVVIKNQKMLGRSASRNIGAKQAKGDLLLFMDSDVVLDSINELVKSYQHGTILKPIVEYNPMLKGTIKYIQTMSLDRENGYKEFAKKQKPELFWSDCFLISKKLFSKHPFDEHLGKLWGHEDTEFAVWHTKNGAQLIYSKDNIAISNDKNTEPVYKYLEGGVSLRTLEKITNINIRDAFLFCGSAEFRHDNKSKKRFVQLLKLFYQHVYLEYLRKTKKHSSRFLGLYHQEQWKLLCRAANLTYQHPTALESAKKILDKRFLRSCIKLYLDIRMNYFMAVLIDYFNYKRNAKSKYDASARAVHIIRSK